MKITVIGAGAIGGISAAYLAKAGRDVTVVETYDPHLERIREGLIVDGVRGDLTVPLNAILPRQLEGPLDIVLMAVKSAKTLEVLENINSLLESETVIVSLQNGINEDRIASIVGPDRVIGCSIGWGATYIAPGHLSQTSEGPFVIGALNGEMAGRPESVKSVLDDITETKITSNIYGHLWSKLAMNCVIAGCAVLGQTVGESLEPRRNKLLFIKLIREVIHVAEANGVSLEPIDGGLDPYVFTRTDEEAMDLCFQILDIVIAVHGRVKPGPLQDIEKGIKSEVDYITGHCVDKAQEKNVPAPINAKAREIIKKIEAGQATPSPDNLAELEAAESAVID